ncbi:hypothetical protein [Microvirga massiliensis]|uniref:hypothetical protein n=1 Tax=Microvirga massiliensis TaxID=1033741 RepID=UPI00062BBF3B|nr:hypothetical protein [Microvirga massiliensis]
MAPKDPRSEAEKARADLARNAELGLSVPESPLEQKPSVTPRTFGDTTEAARVRSGTDLGVEAGGASPPHGGSSQSPADAEQVSTGRNSTASANSPVSSSRTPQRKE